MALKWIKDLKTDKVSGMDTELEGTPEHLANLLESGLFQECSPPEKVEETIDYKVYLAMRDERAAKATGAATLADMGLAPAAPAEPEPAKQTRGSKPAK